MPPRNLHRIRPRPGRRRGTGDCRGLYKPPTKMTPQSRLRAFLMHVFRLFDVFASRALREQPGERQPGRRVRARQCWTGPVWSLVLCRARAARSLPGTCIRVVVDCARVRQRDRHTALALSEGGISQGSQGSCAARDVTTLAPLSERARDGVGPLRCRGRSARFTRVRQLQEGIGRWTLDRPASHLRARPT